MNKARQQQAKHADLKKASFTQSKPLFDTKSVSEQDSQSQFVDKTQGKRKRFNSDNSQQGLNSQASESSSRRPWKEAKEHKSYVDVISWNANAVDAQNQDEKEQASNNVDQRFVNTINTIESQTQNKVEAFSTFATKFWESGLIRKSEPILEYRTIEGDDNENSRDYQFVVQTEIKKKSQYELQSGTEIKRRTIDEYLEMNKSKIRRLDEVDKYYLRKDAKNYRKIKFVASKSIQTKLTNSGFRFPAFVCMISFVNSARKNMVWRSTLRNVLEKTDADVDIEDYYDQNNLARSWEVASTRTHFQKENEKIKTRTRLARNQIQKDFPTKNSLNDDTEGEKTQSKDELQAKVVNLENKLNRLLKLMKQQNFAKNWR